MNRNDRPGMFTTPLGAALLTGTLAAIPWVANALFLTKIRAPWSWDFLFAFVAGFFSFSAIFFAPVIVMRRGLVAVLAPVLAVPLAFFYASSRFVIFKLVQHLGPVRPLIFTIPAQAFVSIMLGGMTGLILGMLYGSKKCLRCAAMGFLGAAITQAITLPVQYALAYQSAEQYASLIILMFIGRIIIVGCPSLVIDREFRERARKAAQAAREAEQKEPVA